MIWTIGYIAIAFIVFVVALRHGRESVQLRLKTAEDALGDAVCISAFWVAILPMYVALAYLRKPL